MDLLQHTDDVVQTATEPSGLYSDKIRSREKQGGKGVAYEDAGGVRAEIQDHS